MQVPLIASEILGFSIAKRPQTLLFSDVMDTNAAIVVKL
jgi:hypothetical protein